MKKRNIEAERALVPPAKPGLITDMIFKEPRMQKPAVPRRRRNKRLMETLAILQARVSSWIRISIKRGIKVLTRTAEKTVTMICGTVMAAKYASISSPAPKLEARMTSVR